MNVRVSVSVSVIVSASVGVSEGVSVDTPAAVEGDAALHRMAVSLGGEPTPGGEKRIFPASTAKTGEGSLRGRCP